MTQPSTTDIGVIGLVPDVWGDIWQPRHQVMTRLGRHFEVVWLDPAQNWRHAWRSEVSEERLEWETFDEFPSFTVYRHGRLVPQFYKPRVLGQYTEKRRLKNASNHLLKRGCSQIVGYLWRPEFASSLDCDVFDISVYHVDDEYTFSDTELPLDRQEKSLLERVNEVIVHSPALYEKKGRINKNTVVISNGADFEKFSKKELIPSDLAVIKRPVMGYVGVVQSTIDWGLVLDLARRHAEWSFVFVGPMGNLEAIDIEMLEVLNGLPNTSFLGGKSVDQLPSYVQHMDVCMMPYKVNDYTKFIYPLKLHEYLGSGRPAVGTPIRSLIDFDNLIIIADSAEAWSNALRESLSYERNSPEEIKRRQDVARSYDWNVLVDRIAEQIRECIERDRQI